MPRAFANSDQIGAYCGVTPSSAIEPISLEIRSLDGSHRRISGGLRVFRGESLIIGTSEPISLSAIVTAQCDDVWVIGEVVACLRETERCWVIRIKIEHTLKHLEILLRLRNELLAPKSEFATCNLGGENLRCLD